MVDAKQRRGPRQNYFEMGLVPGQKLVFQDCPNEIVEVEDHHYLRWNGRVLALTELRKRLGARSGVGSYSGRIIVDGENLDDRYKKRYPKTVRPLPT